MRPDARQVLLHQNRDAWGGLSQLPDCRGRPAVEPRAGNQFRRQVPGLFPCLREVALRYAFAGQSSQPFPGELQVPASVRQMRARLDNRKWLCRVAVFGPPVESPESLDHRRHRGQIGNEQVGRQVKAHFGNLRADSQRRALAPEPPDNRFMATNAILVFEAAVVEQWAEIASLLCGVHDSPHRIAHPQDLPARGHGLSDRR